MSKNNFAGTSAPSTGNDASQGYSPGSRWVNVQTGVEYVCVSATIDQAAWAVNFDTGLVTVAGLRESLIVPGTPSRTVLIERFEQKPVLDVTIDPTAEDPTVAEFDAIFLANKNFEVAGTNMTAALSTHNVARMGCRMTTAGATNDQAILRPRTNPAAVSRWLAGFSSNLSPVWATSFRLPSVSLVTVKAALALTSAHDLTTDADQVGLWLTTAETESVVDNPNFQIVTSIGGTDVAVDTGIEAAADTEYRLSIELQSDRTAIIRLNGAQLLQTPALGASKTFLPFLSIEDISAGVAKSLDYRYMAMSMLNAA